MKDRKIVYLEINVDWLLRLAEERGGLSHLAASISGPSYRRTEPFALPDDARIVGVELRSPQLMERAILQIAMESDSLPDACRDGGMADAGIVSSMARAEEAKDRGNVQPRSAG